jgi:hypothetical protein
MATTPVFYVNSPVSGTQYWAPMWNGVIASGETLSVTIKTFTGANGGGSLIAVTTIQAILWDQTNNASAGSHSDPSVNTETTSNTSTNGHMFKCSGIYTGSGVGSMSMQMTYTASTAFIPTTPTFSPANGGIGTAVTLTGTRFTDATIVQFNGTNVSSFTVVSDTSITTTVPTGATTGVITVGNPAGSTNSASNFTVAQAWVNTGTLGSPVWTAGVVYVNTGTLGSPIWTPAASVDVNTGTLGSPIWTPGA